MRTLYLAILIILLTGLTATGQKVTISGYVTDAGSGERMIGATIYEKATLAGTSANNYGFFSLPLARGPVEILVSFLGYEPVVTSFDLTRDTVINFQLVLSARQLDEVTITASRQSKVESSQMSMIDIPIAKFIKLPVLLGEADVLKVIQLLPGVQSGTEGSTGIYVRGGGPDQNLFLLDGVPVYNASHLFGFLSVFNPDAVKSVQLYKGGFPARYGERLSSVVDIRMKEGNEKEFHGNFSIGLIASKLSLEGPIIKDKTSFIISARRTYADLLARPLIRAYVYEEDFSSTGGYYFYDLNAKINHKFSDRSRLYLSSYLGKDKAFMREKGISYVYDETGGEKKYRDYSSEFGLGWGNLITALRWNYLISNKIFSNTTLTYSRYVFDIFSEEKAYYFLENRNTRDYFRYFSGIEDLSARIDFDWYPSTSHSVKFGAASTYHNFKPGVTTYRYNPIESSQSIDITFGDIKIDAMEFIAYAEDNFDITPR
ncbi:MAG: TonB-dependent receptor plug domain-containing protein, partial [Bacteroidales bacterium]|nr:TonB-dependent receptor plug domain-containing protein [Bacteroidales bacterium]